MINEEILEKFKWSNFVITKINNDDALVIILIFKDLSHGDNFMNNILSENPFKLEVGINKNLNYYFKIDFLNTDYFIYYDTALNTEQYPPLAWLKNGVPTFITNGMWMNVKSKEGNQYKYNPDLIPLDDSFGSITLEQSVSYAFSKCLRIEFIDGSKRNEPSAVVLVFDKPQGITAYNDLFDLVSYETTFLKAKKNNGKIDISFIDGVSDAHISVKGLTYYETQFDSFYNNQLKGKTFAFLLGLNNPNGDLPVLFSVSQDKGIFTLAGFID